MKRNRIVSTALCLCLGAALLTGCGSTPKETTAATVPAVSVPETTVPETAVPETAVPETAVPETTVPETTIPETTVPVQTASPLFEGVEDFPLSMTYSSGAGGWHTELTLNADGSFTGFYSDSEMGLTGPDYPDGTLYYANFSGSFEVLSANRDNTWTLELAVLSLENQPGEESIENGIRYLAADAYGLDGSTFLLGSPDADPAMLGEFASFSWPGNFEDPVPGTLSCWALYNVSEDCAFFTYN